MDTRAMEHLWGELTQIVQDRGEQKLIVYGVWPMTLKGNDDYVTKGLVSCIN